MTTVQPLMKKCNRCFQEKLLSYFPLIDYENTYKVFDEESRTLVAAMKDRYKYGRWNRCQVCIEEFRKEMRETFGLNSTGEVLEWQYRGNVDEQIKDAMDFLKPPRLGFLKRKRNKRGLYIRLG
ncbi:MAG: hypothetical protein WBZ36_20730 [Candidatus Nitrosopolaris sp.]